MSGGKGAGARMAMMLMLGIATPAQVQADADLQPSPQIAVDPAAMALPRKSIDVLTFLDRASIRSEIAIGGHYVQGPVLPAPPGMVAGPVLTGGGTGTGGLLSFENAVRKAVAWHPSLDEAVGRLNQSEAQIGVARSGYRPQLSGGLNTGVDIARGARWQPRADLSLSQMVHDFGKVRSAVDAAQAGTQISRAQILQAVDELIRNTAYAVIEVQRYHALLEVARAQLDSIGKIDKLVRYRTDRGASTRSDAVQASARVEAAQAAIQDITGQLDRWKSNLGYLVGSTGPVDASADIPGWFLHSCARPDPDWTQVPALLQSEARQDEAQANLRGSRASRLPSLALGADVTSNLRDPLGGRSEVLVGLRVSSSIFDGGASRARQSAADYAVRTADAAVLTIRNEVARSLQESREQIGSIESRIDILSQRRGMMEETGKLYRLQYLEMGTRTLIDLLNAEQELHQVRFDAVNADHDMRRLNADCLFNSGRTRDAFVLSGTVLRGVTL